MHLKCFIPDRGALPKRLTRFATTVATCLYIWPVIFALLFSCVATPDPTESGASHIVANVPFYPQREYQCGPASLAGALNYWDVPVSPQDIAAEIYSEAAGGTLDVDMVLFAKRKGLEARQYQGSLEDIKRNVKRGYPIIVLVDQGFWLYQQNHFMVVVGYNEKEVIVNSGKEPLKPIPLKDFLKSWEKTKRWTLLITRKR